MLKFRINRLLDHYRCQAGPTERDRDHIVFDFEFFLRLFNQIKCGGAAERQMVEAHVGSGRLAADLPQAHYYPPALFRLFGADEQNVQLGHIDKTGRTRQQPTAELAFHRHRQERIGSSPAEASTWRLDKLARERDDFAGSPLSRETVMDYAAVFRRAAAGDACARALRDHSLQIWSATAVNLIHAYDPEKLIVCGGIMANAGVIIPAVQTYVARHAHTPWGRVEVVPSALGDEAALLECEWLWQQETSKTIFCEET